MKKILALILGALFLKTPVAVAETSIFALDDSASFTVARAVKLGDSDGDYGTAPTVSAKKETNLKRNECKSDSDCASSQKCVGGKCESVCTGSTCSGETPDCSAEKHKAVCKCTETSCGSGKKCSDGKCVPCSVGDKCNCSGAQVIVSGGKCGCSASSTCPAGQYKTDDCSCRNCVKDDTYNRCGCVAPLVPDGKGGCYCKEKTCNAGNSFSTSSCGCVPCTDNASCQYPCKNGTPDGKGGCTPYVCTNDNDCDTGYYCENPSTASAECKPTVCAENQYFNGTTCRYCAQDYGPCIRCDATKCLECAGSYTAGLSSCEAGKMLVQTGVCGMCVNCPKGQKCNCPDNKVSDGNGKCVAQTSSCTYIDKNTCMMKTGTHCTTDSKGCYVKGTTCISGYWWGYIGLTHMDSCRPCPANSVSGSCFENKVKCRDGYVLKGGYVCQKCDNSCGTCSDAGPDSCLTCASGYYTFARRPESSPGYCCKGMHTSNINECQYH